MTRESLLPCETYAVLKSKIAMNETNATTGQDPFEQLQWTAGLIITALMCLLVLLLLVVGLFGGAFRGTRCWGAIVSRLWKELRRDARAGTGRI